MSLGSNDQFVEATNCEYRRQRARPPSPILVTYRFYAEAGCEIAGVLSG